MARRGLVRFLRWLAAMLTLVAVVLAGLVIGLLVMVALLSAVKGTPVCRVATLEDPLVPGASDPRFRSAMELLSRTSLAPGHAVEVFVNGDETYPRLWADLRAARSCITMQMYYCEAPGRQWRAGGRQAARAGRYSSG